MSSCTDITKYKFDPRGVKPQPAPLDGQTASLKKSSNLVIGPPICHVKAESREIVQMLGRFGYVIDKEFNGRRGFFSFKGYHVLRPSQYVTIKVSNINPNKTSKRVFNFVSSEIAILKLFKRLPSKWRDRFPQLLDAIFNGDYVIMVLKYIEGIDMYEYISLFQGARAPPEKVKDIISQLAQLIEVLHNAKIVHRDIKLENVLIYNGIVYLIDFGFSRTVGDGQNGTCLCSRHCGSVHYVAPELVLGKLYDGFKSDVWSLGVLAFAMHEGRFPFDDKWGNTRNVMDYICRNSPHYKFSYRVKAKVIIMRMLDKNPSNRASIHSVVTFFASY